MRKILILTLILIYQGVKGQESITYDSLNIRILNKGKHYVKEYTLTIDGNNYTYKDIWKNKYSEYQRLPYIWPSNRSKTTVIIKLLGYDKWSTTVKMPIDHVGEKKLLKGHYTIEIGTRRKKGRLEVYELLIEEIETN